MIWMPWKLNWKRLPPGPPVMWWLPPRRSTGSLPSVPAMVWPQFFKDLGANGVVSGGQTMNPSTESILEGVDKIPAEVVFVLPNNGNIIMAAQQC